MAHKNCVIFASLNYMHFGTLSMMFTQEGLLKTAVLKHLSHYTFKCVRIHMRLPIVMTMTTNPQLPRHTRSSINVLCV